MRHSRRKKNRKTGGGCGCSKGIVGGSPHLSQLDTKYYYPYNSNLTVDPQNPASMIDETLAGDFSRVNGGRPRRRRNTTPKNKNKKRGGMSIYNHFMNSGSSMNAYSSFGIVNSGSVQADTITGLGVVTSNSGTDQPVLSQPYGPNNPPLV